MINPATGEPFVEVPAASPPSSTRPSLPRTRRSRRWRATPLGQPPGASSAASATSSATNVDELALLLTLEQGKPLAKARGEIESRRCGRSTSSRRQTGPVEVIRDDETGADRGAARAGRGRRRRSRPGTTRILPALWKIGPALVAGNTVIVKPSPYTPVATLRLGELLQERPAARGAAGARRRRRSRAAMTAHPGIDKISFTGSVRDRQGDHGRRGRHAQATDARARRQRRRASCSTTPTRPRSAPDLYWGGLSNCGQVCAGLKRLYVPESLPTTIAEAARRRGRHGRRRRRARGRRATSDRCRTSRSSTASGRLAEDAAARGADVVLPRRGPRRARLLPPGHAGPRRRRRRAAGRRGAVRAGPADPHLPRPRRRGAPGQRLTGTASARRSGRRDEPRAARSRERLDAGTVWVNQHPVLSADIPFGGVKQSGIGVECSLHGLHAYTDIRVSNVKR